MNPRRLVDLEPKGLRAQLLRAGTAMQPPDSTYQKTFLGLGVAGTTLGATKVVGAAVGASGAKTFLSGVLVKWIAIGFVGGTTLLGAAHVTGVWRSQAAPSSTSVRQAATPLPQALHRGAARGQTIAEGAPMQGAPVVDESQPLPEPAPTGATPTRAATSASPPVRAMGQRPVTNAAPGDPEQQLARDPVNSPSALAAEVALVDRIRQAVDRGDPARALDLIERHRRSFGAPKLSEEVAFFRARALELAGRRSEAQRALEAFKADYPASPLTERH